MINNNKKINLLVTWQKFVTNILVFFFFSPHPGISVIFLENAAPRDRNEHTLILGKLLLMFLGDMLVAQLCLTLCDPMDSSLLVSFVHGIPQTRILEWIAIPFSRGPPQPRDQTWFSGIAGRFFTIWASRRVQLSWFSRYVTGYFWTLFCLLSSSCPLNVRMP